MTDLADLESRFSGRLLTEGEDTAPFLTDWRGIWRGKALAVAQPDTVEGVAAIVRWCAERGIALVPQGGNTGMSGGATPDADGKALVLSLARLARIRAIDPVNDTITLDAGCILANVQQSAEQADRLFPLSLAAEGSCTIGGNLATNAGGTGVLRYGNARDLCLGIEVVTAQGEIWDGLRGLRKDNSGYDLRDLYIGSEGTLGVITGAVMKLFPRPTSLTTCFVACPSIKAATTILARLKARYDSQLTGFEILTDQCLALVEAHVPGCRSPLSARAPWYALIELASFDPDIDMHDAMEGLLASAFEEGLLDDATIAASLSQRDDFWRLRESIAEAQGAIGKTIKHDISLPISRIDEFIAKTLPAIAGRWPDMLPVVFGHLGDGNLHFNFSPVAGSDQDAFLAEQDELNSIVHDMVVALGGSISAEHGLGVLRRDEAARFKSPVEMGLICAIKGALDPRGILNPGKVLPPETLNGKDASWL